MRHGHYLQKRGDRYRFRARLPKGLVSFDLPGEIVVNLRTNSHAVAIRRARALRVAMETLLTDFATASDRTEVERRIRAWINANTEAWELNLSMSGGFAFLDREEADQMGHEPARELDDLFRAVADLTVRPRLRHAVVAALSGRRPQAIVALEPLIASALADVAPGTDRASPEGHLLVRTILRGLVTMFDEQAQIESGQVVPIPKSFSATPPQKSSSKPGQVPFLAHWQAFETSKLAEREWKDDTASNARSSLRLFREFVGDGAASTIVRINVSAFRADLFKLPSLYDKARQWRDMPLRAIISDAEEQDRAGRAEGRLSISRMKLRTVDKHTGNLLEYWAWCQTNGHIGQELENPFTGFIKSKPKGRRARHERGAWPQPMIVDLFASPVWKGCKNLSRRTKPGHEIFRDARFWIPLWGRLTGAREDEICSRLVGDIGFIDDIAFLKIRGSKTPESDRDLPIPQGLLDMGFLEYRFWGREPNEPLFPELMPQGPGQRRSAAFSGWFTEYRKGIRCYVRLIDFHSFRHNVSTDLANVPGLNPGWADEITGHDSPVRTSERSRYNKGVFMQHLKETIDRIQIGVDLNHLTYTGSRNQQAPHAREEIEAFVALAERDMRIKATRRKPVASNA